MGGCAGLPGGVGVKHYWAADGRRYTQIKILKIFYLRASVFISGPNCFGIYSATMRHIILALLLVAAGWAQQIRSPEVGTDRRGTFRLLAPQAGEGGGSGEFQKGSQKFGKDEKGGWGI